MELNMDVVDQSDEHAQPLIDAALAEAHQRALMDNVPFIKGDCEVCADPSERLVQCTHKKDGPVWACARCRDKLKLPVMRT
jgi:hypothetical protein